MSTFSNENHVTPGFTSDAINEFAFRLNCDSKFLMKVLTSLFKKIVRSDDFYWTVVIFSKTGTRGSHCRLDAVVSCCVQLSPLLCNILWITMKLHNIELYYYKYLLFLYAILNNLNDNCYWNAIFGIKTLKLILIFVSAFHWLSNYALLKPQNLTS